LIGDPGPRTWPARRRNPGAAADDVGNAARAGVRLIIWCRGFGGQVESNPSEMAEWSGAETPVLDWRKQLGLLKNVEAGK
jgi:hypothetical protein